MCECVSVRVRGESASEFTVTYPFPVKGGDLYSDQSVSRGHSWTLSGKQGATTLTLTPLPHSHSRTLSLSLLVSGRGVGGRPTLAGDTLLQGAPQDRRLSAAHDGATLFTCTAKVWVLLPHHIHAHTHTHSHSHSHSHSLSLTVSGPVLSQTTKERPSPTEN